MKALSSNGEKRENEAQKGMTTCTYNTHIQSNIISYVKYKLISVWVIVGRGSKCRIDGESVYKQHLGKD